MCGRYRLSRRKRLVEEYFDSTGEDDWSPRYNIAPTQPIPVIRQNPILAEVPNEEMVIGVAGPILASRWGAMYGPHCG